MAIYNVFDGGNDRQYGVSCATGKVELPSFSQPDQRADGAYGYRHMIEWNDAVRRLRDWYGVKLEDLAVGDKLRIFLSPNHATLQSVFVDFRNPLAGFKFNLKTVQDLDLTAQIYESTYDNATGEVLTENKSSGLPENLGGAVAPYTQFAYLFDNRPHSAKVDALELEIVSLPANGWANSDVLFVRRFEMDGMQV